MKISTCKVQNEIIEGFNKQIGELNEKRKQAVQVKQGLETMLVSSLVNFINNIILLFIRKVSQAALVASPAKTQRALPMIIHALISDTFLSECIICVCNLHD